MSENSQSGGKEIECSAMADLTLVSTAPETKSVIDSAGKPLTFKFNKTCSARRRERGQIQVLVGRVPLRLGPVRGEHVGLGSARRDDLRDERAIKI